MPVVKVLQGHTSPETAYVVDDYPYGGLRCKIRYWLETAEKGSKKGQVRFMSQTTNPKRSGEFWNKPKAGTYNEFSVMYLNEEEHVTYMPLHAYYSCVGDRFEPFWEIQDQLTEEQRAKLAEMEKQSRRVNPTCWHEYDIKTGKIPADTPAPEPSIKLTSVTQYG